MYAVVDMAPPLGQPLLVCMDGKEWEIATAWSYDRPCRKKVWLIRHTMKEVEIKYGHIWMMLPQL